MEWVKIRMERVKKFNNRLTLTMAEDETVPSEACNNVFSNDGSFLERFKKLQKEKDETDKKPSTIKVPPLLIPGKKLLTKRKPLPQTKTIKDEEKPPDLKKTKGLNQVLFNAPLTLL